MQSLELVHNALSLCAERLEHGHHADVDARPWCDDYDICAGEKEKQCATKRAVGVLLHPRMLRGCREVRTCNLCSSGNICQVVVPAWCTQSRARSVGVD